jgi:hypothetical protein
MLHHWGGGIEEGSEQGYVSSIKWRSQKLSYSAKSLVIALFLDLWFTGQFWQRRNSVLCTKVPPKDPRHCMVVHLEIGRNWNWQSESIGGDKTSRILFVCLLGSLLSTVLSWVIEISWSARNMTYATNRSDLLVELYCTRLLRTGFK